ncbi:MAG: carbohydrate ABC transporter permease [Clostridiales bacterium]|nr:carbohydrate ABC transporter permease [Clostridiales bacterium]
MRGQTRRKRIRLNVFDVLIYFFLILFASITLYPFLNVVATSLSPMPEYLKHPLMIFPRDITLDTYALIFRMGDIWSGYANTLIVAGASAAISIVLTVATAYPLSRKNLKGRKIFIIYLMFTMLFNGGMIPNFILVRSLGLYDTLWALILPGCMGAWGVFIMQNFISATPESLRESAFLDGAGELRVLVQIVAPLIGPAIAYLILTSVVGSWNSYFSAMIYLRDRGKWPLQLMLREILLAGNAHMNTQDAVSETDVYFTFFNIKTANIVISILPIICVYPFLQKYFVKGVMVGSVKG